MSEINPEQLNSNQDRRERQAQKKAIREAESSKVRHKRIFKKISYWIFGLLIVGGSLWLIVRYTGPEGQDYSQAYPLLGRNHVADGSSIVYNSNPPTSGDHYAVPAPARFYDKELPDEQLVHNLEHGHIWIAYKPGLSEEIVNIIKDLSGGFIIATPRSASDTDIALVAWGRLDKFNLEAGGVDSQRINDFISRYKNRGPEKVGVPRGHGG